ncbi:effector-associated domain 2-containing protein [Streptomyces ureilyticus]|uniref:effector-associated domain 2-containing protein n=1 Tax=Streptomyces ureilyticus TaxID=1775131 RepID=UPI002E2A7E4C|nr:trypsin-like peptidase domain-containing protein [Streptomyces ureilyticus]
MGPEQGQVRVLSKDGVLYGAGVLVAPAGHGVHVLTCAHVVAAALGLPGPGRQTGMEGPGGLLPDGGLLVDLPGRAWSAVVRLVPGGWFPPPPLDRVVPGQELADCGDLAVLAPHGDSPRLRPQEAPLPLAECGPADERRVAIIGYPRGSPAGLIATARVTGRGGPCPEWVQLDGVRMTGAVVERGFSGAAVWDPAIRRVIGLVTAAAKDRTVKVAWMLPMEAAARLWPPLSGALRAPAPRPCSPPSMEESYELAEALLDVPQIGHDSGRLLRRQLPAAVRRNVPDHPWPRQQLQAVVQACAEQPGGCAALRAAVDGLGGGSAPAAAALAVLARVCCSDGEAPGEPR